MIYFDATCACRSAQSTGMPKMARRIFAELKRRTEVHPIFWNNVGHRYQELGRRERRLLEQPFAPGHRPSARPEWYGENPLINLWRLLSLNRFTLETMGAGDVLFIPDIYRDGRRAVLAAFLKDTAARSVAVFHDAADVRLPALHRGQGEKVGRYIQSLALFNCIICVSEESRQDLLSLWEEYGAVATAATVEGWPADTEVAENQSTDVSDPVILFVSSFTPRKNHRVLLDAAERLWDCGIRFQLNLIGRSAGPARNKVVAAIRRLRHRGRPVEWLRHVDDEKLRVAYGSCQFTVYPSLKEGFGLPIMESLLHGKPCLCGGNGALGEIAAGGGCLIIDQTSPDALASGMEKLLTDSALHARLSAEARSRTFRSWTNYTDHLEGHLQVRRGQSPPRSEAKTEAREDGCR